MQSESSQPIRIRPIWIAGIACALLAVLAFFWANIDQRASRTSVPTSLDSKNDSNSSANHLALRERIEAHLAQTEAQIQLLGNQSYPAIEVLFSKAFDNVPSYSKSILGWRSKWNLVLDKLPGNDKDRHERYLKEQFEQQIFTPVQLESAVRQAVRERLIQVRDIENQMLIRIRADIEGLPELAQLDALGADQFENRFQQAIAQASEVVSEDLSSNIESQLVSLVAGEVMAQVAIRMGVSAGILSTGASSGWATFGVGLVAGVVIDQLVTRIWDWWSEPEVELSFQISKQLSLVHDLICRGDSSSTGLDGRFRQWTNERDQIRRDAIMRIFFSSEMQNALSKTQL